MLQIHDAVWWLAADDELMVAPLDAATGTVAWAQAHPADPMDHPEPDVVLGIHDSLIAGAHPSAAVDAAQVVNPTPSHPGYLVRDQGGVDLARYDRLDLAEQAADRAAGSVHAWGRIGHGPVGWHQLNLASATPRQTPRLPAAGTAAVAGSRAVPAAHRDHQTGVTR